MDIVKEDENNNQILGHDPQLIRSSIVFKGKNNRLICEKNVKLRNSKILFAGNNSVVYLASSRIPIAISVGMFNNSTVFIDEDMNINSKIFFSVSEEKNIFIGRGNLISMNTWIRVADPHLIYDCDTHKRINFSKSVYIGDHVWIGQEALILKGSKIGSGSIIGAKAVLSNKSVKSNTIFAGNPGKEIKKNIFWDYDCVHRYTEKETKASAINESNQYIYEKDDETISFDEIEEKLKNTPDVDERINYLIKIRNNKSHNRFYI